MFTGIVTAIGTIAAADQRGDLRLRITAPLDPARIDIGASIACSGVCLTVVERGGTAGDAWFEVDLSGETVSRTVPGMWDAGAELNIEPSLRVGDELGGHIVTGHVDSVGDVVKVARDGDSWHIAIRARAEMSPFIAEKGSITVNGVSLTVNDVRDRPDGTCDFLLNIIPHTAAVTTLGSLAAGDKVNLEIDVLARYLKRMQSIAAAR
jgi:riboflavin synthase